MKNRATHGRSVVRAHASYPARQGSAVLALASVVALALATPAPAQQTPAHATVVAPHAELRGQVDWQAHPAMHRLYPTFFGEGMRDEAPANLTWDHTFDQQIYTPFMRHSGVRLFGAAAMAAERAESPGQAHRVIVDQLERVEDWVAAHPDDFVLARSPEAARESLTTSHRMVLMHQIEGGRRILLDPRDAAYWRSRGVALVTVMHLLDDELGRAAMNLGPTSALFNALFDGIGWAHARPGGLTPRGRAAIVALARAGIMVDLTHMAPAALDDALAVCRTHGIAPVVTHAIYRPIQDSERGLTAAQIVEVYRLGGMVALPIDGNSLDPLRPTIAIPPGLERGTMDMFRFHLETVHRLLRDHAVEIAGRPWAQLGEAERTRFAVGWASDWNGWTVHSRPTPARAVHGARLDIDRIGLAHPGLLPQYWQRLREDGMDFDPLDRSLERSLQIWEAVRAHAQQMP